MECYQKAADLGNSTARQILNSKGTYIPNPVKGKNTYDNLIYPDFITKTSIIADTYTSTLPKSMAKINRKGFNPFKKYDSQINKKS